MVPFYRSVKCPAVSGPVRPEADGPARGFQRRAAAGVVRRPNHPGRQDRGAAIETFPTASEALWCPLREGAAAIVAPPRA